MAGVAQCGAELKPAFNNHDKEAMMSIVRRLCACVVSTALLTGAFGSAVAADPLELLVPGQLSAATEGTYPPFSMQNEQGELDGIDVRLMREVARRLGLEYKPIVTKFDSLLIGLEANQFDLVESPLDITDERRQRLTFSDGWIESGARLVVPTDSPVKLPGDISGKTIGVLAASTWGDLAAPLKPSELKTYKSESDAVQDLVNGNIDAIVTDGISASYNIKQNNLALRLVDTPLSTLQKAWSIKKGKPNLVKAINKAIADIIADGAYAKLTADFIGFDAAPKDPIRSNL
jgi:polar amino acid transport system substrate-binding protein